VKQTEERFVHGYKDVPSLAAIRERVRERGMSVSTAAAAEAAVAAVSTSSLVSTSVTDPAAVTGPGALVGGNTHKDRFDRTDTDTPQSTGDTPLDAPSRDANVTSITGNGAAKSNAGKDVKMEPSTSPSSTASTASTSSSVSTASASPTSNVVPDRKKQEHPLRHAWYVPVICFTPHCPVPV
jgi:hypothetical protein